MTWMDEFRNESDAILDQACLLREIADGARLMGNKDLALRLDGMASAIATAAEKIDNLVSKKLDTDYTQARDAFASAVSGVIGFVGSKDGDADRKSV